MERSVADSLSNGSLSRSIQDQLSQKYSCLAVDGILPVYLLPVRQQDNSVDCGVYAIANAIEFVVDNGNPMANYDIAVMRSHLIQCLESGELHPFPKCPPPKNTRTTAQNNGLQYYSITFLFSINWLRLLESDYNYIQFTEHIVYIKESIPVTLCRLYSHKINISE